MIGAARVEEAEAWNRDETEGKWAALSDNEHLGRLGPLRLVFVAREQFGTEAGLGTDRWMPTGTRSAHDVPLGVAGERQSIDSPGRSKEQDATGRVDG